MEGFDLNTILGYFTEMLGNVEVSELIKTLTAAIQKIVEVLKPMLSSLTEGSTTTEPAA